MASDNPAVAVFRDRGGNRRNEEAANFVCADNCR
jgi:hypothetical protein